MENETPTPSAEEYGYISLLINLADDNSTRGVFDSPSDNSGTGMFVFNDGLEQERAIANNAEAHWVLAYDNNQNIIARLQLEYLQDISQPTGNGTVYKGICKVPLNDPFLTSVNNMRVILNANADLQSELKKDEPDIDLISSDKLFYTENGYDYFTMTTAMVVSNNSVLPSTTLLKDNNGSLITFKSIEDALANPSVTLYVERMQSKFTVVFNQNGTEYYFNNGELWANDAKVENKALVFYPSGELNKLKIITRYNGEDDLNSARNVNWEANIVGWNVNATEPKEYLFKNFGTSPTSYSSWNYSSDGKVIRNIWAEDEHYTDDASTYPDQYREAYDTSTTVGLNSFGAYETTPGNYKLTYYPFNALSARGMRQYNGENTYNPTNAFKGISDPIGDLAHFRSGEHLIICAQLIIDDENFDHDLFDSNTTNDGLLVEDGKKVTSKYFTNNFFYTEDAYKDYFLLVMQNNLKSTNKCVSDLTKDGPDFIPNEVFNSSEDNPLFYVNDNGTFRTAKREDFEIKPVHIVGGDGWCYPYPKSEGENTCLWVKRENNNYHQVTKSEYDKFVYGYAFYFAMCFHEGRMYYPLPVTHNINRKAEADFGHRTADYGVVRNNWYHYSITGLKSVGISVQDPTQPIIPNNDPSQLGVGFEVMIIPWHVVEEFVSI